MNIISTVKKSILPNGSVLRMSFTIEGIYFIFLETNRASDLEYIIPRVDKEMLWNGDKVDDANRNYNDLQNNPLIGGGK